MMKGTQAVSQTKCNFALFRLHAFPRDFVVVGAADPQLMIVIEFMANGSLESFLKVSVNHICGFPIPRKMRGEGKRGGACRNSTIRGQDCTVTGVRRCDDNNTSDKFKAVFAARLVWLRNSTLSLATY